LKPNQIVIIFEFVVLKTSKIKAKKGINKNKNEKTIVTYFFTKGTLFLASAN
jgi:hypothetical protein